MIFVNTDLDTAIKRNDMRPRSLPTTQVATMWKAVQKNIGRFQSMFKDNMLILDNNDGDDFSSTAQYGYKWGKKFAEKPIKHIQAIKWLASFKEMTEATLASSHSAILDALWTDVKKKLETDLKRGGNLKDLDDIAALVNKKVELDTRHKGYSRLKKRK
jgi:hypothetical protein